MHLNHYSSLCLAALTLTPGSATPIGGDNTNNSTIQVSHIVVSPELNYPDAWVSNDLAVPANNTTGLEKRQMGRVCQALGGIASVCVIYNTFKDDIPAFADNMKNWSNEGNCSPQYGDWGPNGEVSYIYRPAGSCTTTAEYGTIDGALKRHFETLHPDQFCRTECIDFTHGSDDFHGYLLVGPSDGFDSTKTCNGDLGFGKCVNGGKKDE